MNGNVQTPLGLAVPGTSVAILTQPANTTTQPGTPLATLYAASTTNAATITGASWSGQQITFVLSATPPADIVAGSYIAVSGVTPSTYNSTTEFPWLVVSVSGNNVIVAALTNPGAYSSGGTVATSVLPNPTLTDGNGYWFAYAASGLYTVQVFGPTITTEVYPDQQNGTVAGGSVLSVGLSLPAQLIVSGSPVTTSGTLTGVWANESANRIFSGPSSGAAAAPTFRALVTADLPAGVGTVTSVSATLTVPGIFSSTVTGSPITSSGTLGFSFTLANENANTVFAGPASGSPAPPTFRALVAADLGITIGTAPVFIQAPGVPVTGPLYSSYGAANTIAVFGFYLDRQILFSSMSIYVHDRDSVSTYDFGIYNASGTLVANLGTLAYTSNATFYTKSTVQGNVTLAAGWYYFAQTGSGGGGGDVLQLAGSYVGMYAYALTSATAATGGTLPASITPPSASLSGADTGGNAAFIPNFMLSP